MSWDHNITINVSYSDGSTPSNVDVTVYDTGFGGDSASDATDSNGVARVNIPTVMTGGAISVEIYCQGEKFGPYSADDGDSFSITLSNP